MLKAFDTVKPTDADLVKIGELREAFSTLATLVLARVPVGRERAIVMTKLEEAAMWTTKAITHATGS